MKKECCIDLYAGLLGAGKTTLIRQLLVTEYAGKKVAIIENEIGRVNLDAELLRPAQAQITVREMTGGCVCCTIRGAFTEAIDLLTEEVGPDYIIIEPTGAADLEGLVQACEKCHSALLRRMVMIVNAKKIVRLLTVVGDFYREQIEKATCIYLNFTEGMGEDDLEKARAEIRKLNPTARLVDTPIAKIDADTFDVGESEKWARAGTEAETENCSQPGRQSRSDLQPEPERQSQPERQSRSDLQSEPKRQSQPGRQSHPGPLSSRSHSRFTIRALDAEQAARISLPGMRPLRAMNGALRVAATASLRQRDEQSDGEDNKKTEAAEQVLYTLTVRYSAALTPEQFMKLENMLSDYEDSRLWRAKGVFLLTTGERKRLDLTFGDLFTEEFSSEAGASENLKENRPAGELVLIGPGVDRNMGEQLFYLP